jgi:hypothetical protein
VREFPGLERWVDCGGVGFYARQGQQVIPDIYSSTTRWLPRRRTPFPSILCSEVWPCDHVLANGVEEVVMCQLPASCWSTALLIFDFLPSGASVPGLPRGPWAAGLVKETDSPECAGLLNPGCSSQGELSTLLSGFSSYYLGSLSLSGTSS